MARSTVRFGVLGLAGVIVLVLSGACRALPAEPDSLPATPTLGAGNYMLRIESGAPVGSATFCTALTFGDPPLSASSASIPVVVTQTGSAWSMRPTADVDRGLVISLQVVGLTFEGTAAGSVADGPAVVIAFGTPGDPVVPVTLSGTAVANDVLSGYATGRVEFSADGASAGSTSYAWTLQRRN